MILKRLFTLFYIGAFAIGCPVASAAGTYQLNDYANALRAGDKQRIEMLRAYILGAAETHQVYSRMFRDWTSVPLVCSGENRFNAAELATLVESKMSTLRRRYGNEVMGMPIVDVVRMIMEEDYSCW